MIWKWCELFPLTANFILLYNTEETTGCRMATAEIMDERCMRGHHCGRDNCNIWACTALTHEEGRLACKQPQTASPPLWWGETEKRRGATASAQEKQRVRRKRPERSTKPQREAWGTREHNDVISIDSQGEQIFTPLCNCYHWTDREEVGGLFTLNFNSIRRNNRVRSPAGTRAQTKRTSESVTACSATRNKPELLIARGAGTQRVCLSTFICAL